MKGSLLLAGATLLGCTSAKLHSLKLKKVSLKEQLVSHFDPLDLAELGVAMFSFFQVLMDTVCRNMPTLTSRSSL